MKKLIGICILFCVISCTKSAKDVLQNKPKVIYATAQGVDYDDKTTDFPIILLRTGE